LNRHWRPEEIAALHTRANAWFAENDITNDAVKRSLTAFRDNEHRKRPDTTDDESPSPHPPSPSPQPLVEQLTERELDVLELLAQRLSYKEISDKLYVSTATVKSHIHNIYGKLNVSKRREAVEKAMKIGILPGGA
jgi:ATP/maltotriose-dependent transcriptional regulator MalT